MMMLVLMIIMLIMMVMILMMTTIISITISSSSISSSSVSIIIVIIIMLMMSGKPKLAECEKGAIFASPRRRRALPPTCARENFACLGCRPGLLTPAARSAPRPRSTTLPMGKIGAAHRRGAPRVAAHVDFDPFHALYRRDLFRAHFGGLS